MLKARLFEEATAKLWHEGLISGEMHMGTGEEGIIAGVVSHLKDGDAMALDHRGTAALLMRGIEPVPLLRELLGHKEGLCGGMGGHMHLFSKEHLAASSGIVGSEGPAAAGFALAAQYLRPHASVIEDYLGLHGGQGDPVRGVDQLGDAVHEKNGAAVVEERSCGLGEISGLQIGTELVDELLQARGQNGLINRVAIGHIHHAARGGGYLLDVKAKVDFAGIDAR